MYDYPLDYDWSTDEILIVMNLYNDVEKAQEEGIEANEFMDAYNAYREVLNSKAEEKKYEREFKDASSYSIFTVYKEALKGGFIKL